MSERNSKTDKLHLNENFQIPQVKLKYCLELSAETAKKKKKRKKKIIEIIDLLSFTFSKLYQKRFKVQN